MFEELNPGKLGTPQEMYQIVMLLWEHAQFRSLSCLVRHILLCIFSLSILFYFFSLSSRVQGPESRVQGPGSSLGSSPGFILCLDFTSRSI